ncbi:MAG: DUF5753 domain-containing protein [Pseudonocardia sp.]|nr:DUF5753 domain-containing protein [Pseudonocardia sp.]
MEATAKKIGDFAPAVVPGLLQTEAYMRESAVPGGLDEDALERWVVARLNRQRLLDDPRRRFTVIVTAGATGGGRGRPGHGGAGRHGAHLVHRSPPTGGSYRERSGGASPAVHDLASSTSCVALSSW